MPSQRIWNSTVPFSPMDQSDSKALNCLDSNPVSHTESKEGELDKMNPLKNALFWKIMNQGTAKHEWRHGTEKQSIIAQAECKY